LNDAQHVHGITSNQHDVSRFYCHTVYANGNPTSASQGQHFTRSPVMATIASGLNCFTFLLFLRQNLREIFIQPISEATHCAACLLSPVIIMH
jgi:hypothetical protein